MTSKIKSSDHQNYSELVEEKAERYDEIGFLTVSLTVDGQSALEHLKDSLDDTNLDELCGKYETIQEDPIKEDLILRVFDMSRFGLTSTFYINVNIFPTPELLIECDIRQEG